MKVLLPRGVLAAAGGKVAKARGEGWVGAALPAFNGKERGLRIGRNRDLRCPATWQISLRRAADVLPLAISIEAVGGTEALRFERRVDDGGGRWFSGSAHGYRGVPRASRRGVVR